MKEYSKSVKEILDKNGWKFSRHGGKGSHDIWQSPNGNKMVTINRNMKSRHTANDILSQAGLNERRLNNGLNGIQMPELLGCSRI